MIEMLMAKDREERYPSAKELLVDLEQLARDEPPVYAKLAVDDGVFQNLAQGQAVEDYSAAQAAQAGRIGGDFSAALTITLAVVAGLSVLMNVILLATQGG
jgi:hypothetical protein